MAPSSKLAGGICGQKDSRESSDTGLLPFCPSSLSLASSVETDAEDFVNVMRARRLPSQLDSDVDFQESFNNAIAICVESFYYDRIEPTLGELQKRLRAAGWGANEVQAVLPMCARRMDTYKLLPPGCHLQSLVLLRHSPEWFKGWIDEVEPKDTFPDDVWEYFQDFLFGVGFEQPDFRFSGGCCDLASFLKGKHIGSGLGAFSFGELRNIVRLAFGPKRQYLAYDALHGGRVTKPSTSWTNHKTFNTFECSSGMMSPEKTPVRKQCTPQSWNRGSRGAQTKLPKVEDLVFAMLREWPLPEEFFAYPDHLQKGCHCCCGFRTLRTYIDSLYRERTRPTLGKVQQRLLCAGWSFREVQGVLPLFARDLHYQIQIPTDGNEICILLRTPPLWFSGCNFEDAPREPVSCISPDVWDVLWTLLQTAFPDWAGTICDCAHDLRQSLFLAPLQNLDLSELCEIVLCQATVSTMPF